MKRKGIYIDKNRECKQYYINNNKNGTTVTAEEKVLSIPWFQNIAQCIRVSLLLKCLVTEIACSKNFTRTALECAIWQYFFFPLTTPELSLLKITSLTIRHQWMRPRFRIQWEPTCQEESHYRKTSNGKNLFKLYLPREGLQGPLPNKIKVKLSKGL